MLELNTIKLTHNGRKVSYQYSYAKQLKKYFNSEQMLYVHYDQDVSAVSESLLVIPFLANMMPIAWFAGFDVSVDEVDETFYSSLKTLKAKFALHYPSIKKKGQLITKKLVQNTIAGNESLLLFSGGLDSFESLSRNYEKNPYLASIHGADVEINDSTRWNQFKEFNKKEAIIANDKLVYIESNLRDFYTYKVDLLVNVGWWGKIQHGMALLGVLAPLTKVLQVKQLFIASSNTSEVSFAWGSTPEIDENMKWANTSIIHDGYHLRRTDKIVNVIDFAKKQSQKFNLRVCYSELRNGANCNQCAKCQRTMLGLILANASPEAYGLEVPENFYELLLANFGKDNSMSKGLEYEWWCLQEKAKENKTFFVIKNEAEERRQLETFKQLDLKVLLNQNAKTFSKTLKIKYILRNKFSGLYNLYKKIRY
jgi:hypothetical protein